MKSTLIYVAGLVAVMWGVGLVNLSLDYKLSEFGIVPRTGDGLIGIPFSPFLHANFNHLLVNTLPLAFLGTFVAIQGRRTFLMTTVFIMFGGGSALWVVGRHGTHVGASGLIFGYFGYLVGRVWYDRSLSSVVVAIVVVVLYGGVVFGILPTTPGVSWEGHLTGLIAGVLVARAMWKQKKPRQGP